MVTRSRSPSITRTWWMSAPAALSRFESEYHGVPAWALVAVIPRAATARAPARVVWRMRVVVVMGSSFRFVDAAGCRVTGVDAGV